jgi:inner membrane protein
LGAAVATAGARRAGHLRPAAATGLCAGLLADADTLIRSSADPLVTLEFHRHFTHALIFVPAGALVAALLLWPLMRRHLTAPRLYLYAFLGYALSGVLDACTSYGTGLLWPFSDERIAWNIIAIVDPLLTALLAAGLGVAVWRRTAVAARVGLVLALGYLALGALQHERAGRTLDDVAASLGHAPERSLVKPTLGNLLLWRGVYVSDGELHAHGLHMAPRPRVYTGETAPLAKVSHGPESRFARLAEGWVVRHPRRPRMLGDARFAMLPTSLRPLWGVETRPDGAVDFVTDRRLTPRERQRFLDMLLGRAPSGAGD